MPLLQRIWRGCRLLLMLLLAVSALPGGRGAEAPGAAAGFVIFKEFPFEPDSQAEVVNYSSYERFPAVDNVVRMDGETIRILPSEEPIYIPAPGVPGATAAQVNQTILAAEQRFPQFASKLETVRQGWAALPKAVVAARTNAPAPVASPTAQAASADDHENVLHTRNGETFHGWTLIGVERDSVVLSHDDGISRVQISELPDNLYGFPENVMARARQLHQPLAGIQKAAASRPRKPAPSLKLPQPQ